MRESRSENSKLLLHKLDGIKTQLGFTGDKATAVDYNRIKYFLSTFMSEHKRVAIYCYGKHTTMLMNDFIAEIRDIVAIVDNNIDRKLVSGFQVIRDEEIELYQIDGVIISSYKFMDEIKKGLKRSHPQIDVLDIYEKLRGDGTEIVGGYYDRGPYNTYCRINLLNAKLKRQYDEKIVLEILREYVGIKDLRMAYQTAEKLECFGNKWSRLICDIKNAYELQLKMVADIPQDALLLLCMDGLRSCDLNEVDMGGCWHFFKRHGCIFENAYSYSTSTFESLIPVFSENTDQRTKYYKQTEVPVENCRFVSEALKQGREVYIYGDGFHYIEGDEIQYSDHPQTFTEKLWDFILDASSNGEGLFYLHELYESHYSYPNPYTETEIVADGNAMLFDYLPSRGGKLRTDYKKQHSDAVHYIDDTLAPFLEQLKCNVLLFADHGNMVLEPETRLEDIPQIEFAAAEDWIHIPFSVAVRFEERCENNDLVSLLDLNEIVIGIMRLDPLWIKRIKHRFIKIGRSSIYNADFKYLYKECGHERELQAFEGFIFDTGEKLVVFEDGQTLLFMGDKPIYDEDRKANLRHEIEKELTVIRL